MEKRRHLGDGVYAYFDGYAILISVNDHRNIPVVAIEPAVLAELNQFYKDMTTKLNKHEESNKST